MELAFKLAAVILAGIAAYFLWQGNGDGAFVAAVFGAVSFFLSVRFQVKGRLKQREIEREEEEMRSSRADEIAKSHDEFEQISANEKMNEQRTTDREQLTK